MASKAGLDPLISKLQHEQRPDFIKTTVVGGSARIARTFLLAFFLCLLSALLRGFPGINLFFGRLPDA
jgi:hypothetical protein